MTEHAISGVILAGGQARRMGHVDKGLHMFRGRALIESVIERLRGQVSEILINANRNQAQYAGYGYRVIEDLVPGYAGPLAGLHSALSSAAHELVLTVPCDSPFLPVNLAPRLHDALQASAADVAVAWTGSQAHPVFCLARRARLAHLDRFLAGGGRKIDAWYANLSVARVAFDDQTEAFANFNTIAELQAAESAE
jgi:molybdopterin-guanine dinucleotide biosynthesis protein A